MQTKASTLRSAVLALALSLAVPAMASPTVSTIAGDTRVTLSSEFVGALDSLGVGVGPTYPARLRDGVAAFPIPTGEVDLGTVKGEIVHSGGLDLIAGDTTVNLSSFVVDTTGDAPVLTGLVKVNDSVVARLTLFDLALNSGPQVSGGTRVGKLRIEDVGVTLSAEAAAALNDVFGVTAFAAGLPIGTARVNTFYFEPDR